LVPATSALEANTFTAAPRRRWDGDGSTAARRRSHKH
jgi:hypothetical protein